MPRSPKSLRTPRQIELANHASFKAEAIWQRECGVCGRQDGNHEPHHVIYQQHLRDRGLPRFDIRNCLRLCAGPLSCHAQHHGGARRVRTRELLDDNIEYAFMELGAFAADYLRRYYDDSNPDPRIRDRDNERMAEAA